MLGRTTAPWMERMWRATQAMGLSGGNRPGVLYPLNVNVVVTSSKLANGPKAACEGSS